MCKFKIIKIWKALVGSRPGIMTPLILCLAIRRTIISVFVYYDLFIAGYCKSMLLLHVSWQMYLSSLWIMTSGFLCSWAPFSILIQGTATSYSKACIIYILKSLQLILVFYCLHIFLSIRNCFQTQWNVFKRQYFYLEETLTGQFW